MLRDIDSLDIKLLISSVGIAGMLAKDIFDTLNSNYMSWLSSTVTTLAFSALATLIVVQWTIRSENFLLYGEPACIQIGHSICVLSWLGCMILYGDNFTTQPLVITFGMGMVDQENLHAEVPVQMDLMYEHLFRLLNETIPGKPGKRSLTQWEATGIRTFCSNASGWWPETEHLVENARSHVRHAETVRLIDVYRHNMKNEMNLLKGLLDRKTDEQGVIGAVGSVIWHNRDLYEALLVETGVKQIPKFYMEDEIKKAMEMARRNS